MKKPISLLLVALVCLPISLSAMADTLKLNHVATNDAFKLFAKTHPGVEILWDETFYMTTGELNAALITGQFDSDVFYLANTFHDYKQMMAKGYCLDLSESEVISGALDKMWPSIASQAMMDGKIYAVPDSISFHYMYCVRESWEAAGMDKEDIPTTYPAFLDFLESWITRIVAQPEANISVNNRWDETLYNEYSYTEWLVGMLMESYIMQCEYAEEALRFDNAELIALLERTKAVGDTLYDYDPAYHGSLELFDGASGMWRGDDVAAYLLTLRINENQPRLIQAFIQMHAVNPATKNRAFAIMLLETMVSNLSGWDQTFLNEDAIPLKNPNYEAGIEETRARVENTKKKLDDPKTVTGDVYIDSLDEDDLEEHLYKYQAVYEYAMTREYDVSPQNLEDYKLFAASLYFPNPGIFFAATDEGQALNQLQRRFATGNITAEAFVKELDQIARMVEMENGQ